MTEWLVWESGDWDSPITVNCETPSDAAEEAVERWYREGRWAGENIGDEIVVSVMEVGSSSKIGFTVEVDWSPTFFAHRIPTRRAQLEPEAE